MEKEQKCKICGRILSEEELFDAAIKYGQKGCPDCLEVLNLQKLAIEHWNAFVRAESNNPIEDKNYSEEKPILTKDGHKVTVRTLGAYETTYKIVGRTRAVKCFIKEVNDTRRFLYLNIGPYFEILESMFNENYRFWKDGGNLWFYTKNALVSYIVIHLKEYLDNGKQNKSRHSIYRFKNIIENNSESLFKKHKIYSIRTFKNSGDIVETQYECFPIKEYLNRLDVVLCKYERIIETIDDYRNNVYAHTGRLKRKDEDEPQLNLVNLRKVFNSLKIIFDCLSYSIAPDMFTNISCDFNIWYDHLNAISDYYDKKLINPQKKKQKI